MHILFLTDNFPPEGNAPATRTYEHAVEWIKKGYKVTIITCAPNFPMGQVFDGYKNGFYSKENMNGIEVLRVKTYITSNEGFVKRTLDYISFMISAFIAGLFVKKPDIIVGTSPQFFTVVSAWALAAVRFKPFVFELRDIWPASITAVGAMKESFAIRMFEKLEMFLYRRASRIIVVTNSFKTELVLRGIDAEKIDIVLNGVDLSKYSPRQKNQVLVDRHGLANKFVIGYIGTHGMAHSLETIVLAAEILKNDGRIVFLFAGGGAALSNVRQLVNDKNLKNIVILGEQKKSMMPKIWALCDVSMVHLKDKPLFNAVIPSKIFESMAMGLPIIIGVPKGEATGIIETNGVGLVIKPENPAEMVEAILKLTNDSQLYAQIKGHSPEMVKKYDRKILALTMMSVFEKLVS